MNKAPTSVVVLSIIGIIFSVLGILGLAWTAVVMFGHILPDNPMIDAVNHDTLYLTVTGILGTIGVGFTILLFAASIASLKLVPWARRAMIVYAWYTIVVGILGTIFNIVYVMPKMQAAMPPGMAAGAIGGMIGGVCGGLLGLIFPICVLYFYSRPHVIDAFNGIFPVSPTNFPVIYPSEPNPPQ